jgi:hypothetical protein
MSASSRHCLLLFNTVCFFPPLYTPSRTSPLVCSFPHLSTLPCLLHPASVCSFLLSAPFRYCRLLPASVCSFPHLPSVCSILSSSVYFFPPLSSPFRYCLLLPASFHLPAPFRIFPPACSFPHLSTCLLLPASFHLPAPFRIFPPACSFPHLSTCLLLSASVYFFSPLSASSRLCLLLPASFHLHLSETGRWGQLSIKRPAQEVGSSL